MVNIPRTPGKSTATWQITMGMLHQCSSQLNSTQIKTILDRLVQSPNYLEALNEFSREYALEGSEPKQTPIGIDEHFAIEQSEREAELEQLVYHLCSLVTRQSECRREALALQHPDLVKQHISLQFPIIEGTRMQHIVKALGLRKNSETEAMGRILHNLLFKEQQFESQNTTADLTDDEKDLLLRSVTDPTDCWEMHPEDNEALKSLQRKGLIEFEIDNENAEFYLTPNGQRLIEQFISAGWKEVEEAGFGAAISEVAR